MSEWASTPLTGIVFPNTERRLDSRVKDLFVKALRSGRYPQGYDRLRSIDDTYTPLGVLCDLATKVGVASWDRIDDEYFISGTQPPASGGSLPLQVREWAGIEGTALSQELPLADMNGDLHPIWRVSDIFKVDFAVIADLIEAQY